MSAAPRSLPASNDLPDIIAGMLSPGDVVAIVGPALTGHKTRRAVATAILVSAGEHWFERKTTETRVVYLALADGVRHVARVFNNAIEALQAAYANGPGDEIREFETGSYSIAESRQSALDACHILTTERTLLIIDDWHTYLSCRGVADENDAAVVAAELALLRTAAQLYGGAVLVLAQTGKDGLEVRGSTAFAAGVDAVWRFDGAVAAEPNVTRRA